MLHNFMALYVDPGSGSVLWQALCAVIAGGLFSIRGAFRLGKKVDHKPDAEHASEIVR